MQCLEVSGAVRLMYRSLGVKGLKYSAGLSNFSPQDGHIILRDLSEGHNCVYIYRNEGFN